MSDSFDTIQNTVIASYDHYVHEQDPRDQVAYMASKFKVDYRLLGMIDIQDKHVINIGCAFPVDELYFAQKVRSWTGIDLSKESIQLARTVTQQGLHPDLAERINYQVQDATDLEFPDNTFDIGLSFSTFDHIPSHDQRQTAFNELARVTKPGGYVIVTTPNRLHLLYYARSRYQQRQNISLYGYEYCFSRGELKEMLKVAGLEPLTFVSTFTYRQLDLSRSPGWQRPFIRFALELVNCFDRFGHRMGYLARK